MWSPANFRPVIQVLETACKQINKIEAVTLKQKVVTQRG
jgi:hypothetical protein